jgi:2-dehydropantoate 2-reductase
MSAEPMKILVAGAGAIGGWLAARLALAGHRVEALGSRGPVQSLVLGEQEAHFTQLDGPPDLLIVAVKAHALGAVARDIAPRIAPGTIVLPALNGVPWWFLGDEPIAAADPGGAAAAAFPLDQVIGCVVHASATRPAPGRVVLNHADALLLGGPSGGTSERIEKLVKTLEEAQLPARVSADIRRDIWYKLWGNATTNPISALTRATADQLLAEPATRAWIREGMVELATLGAAIGCPIAQSPDERMEVTARLGAFKTSMLQDLEAGRPLELDALLGAPIEIARTRGIAVPALERLYGVTALLARNAGLS